MATDAFKIKSPDLRQEGASLRKAVQGDLQWVWTVRITKSGLIIKSLDKAHGAKASTKKVRRSKSKKSK